MAVITHTKPYQTSEHFTFCTGDYVTGRVRVYSPGESAHEKLLLTKLGKNGLRRWQYFRDTFSGGWGERGQKPLSPKSQAVFLSTLRDIQFLPGAKPSLFLTDDGHLELSWRDADGKVIQIEFGPAESEIYHESSGFEEIIPNRELPDIVNNRLNA